MILRDTSRKVWLMAGAIVAASLVSQPAHALDNPLHEATVTARADVDKTKKALTQATTEKKAAVDAWVAVKKAIADAWAGFKDDTACKPVNDSAGSVADAKIIGDCQTKLDQQIASLDDETKSKLGKLKTLNDDLAKKEKAYTEAAETFAKASQDADYAVKQEADATSSTRVHSLEDRLHSARVARCYTAICWGGYDGTQYALEPILDLPVSMFWALGNGGLANYINANQFQVSVSAGVRYWFASDVMSVGVILAQPRLTTASPIRSDYSNQDFPKDAITRPFPTLALGLWGDVFMVTMSYDQLRNTNGTGPVDPRYRFDEVISRTFTLGISLNTAMAARNAIGANLAPATPTTGGTPP